MNPQQKHKELLAKFKENQKCDLCTGKGDDECDNCGGIGYVGISFLDVELLLKELELSHASQITELQNQIKDLQGQVERLKNERNHHEESEMYWITQFQKLADHFYKQDIPNMDKSEYLATKIRNAPKPIY